MGGNPRSAPYKEFWTLSITDAKGALYGTCERQSIYEYCAENARIVHAVGETCDSTTMTTRDTKYLVLIADYCVYMTRSGVCTQSVRLDCEIAGCSS